MHWIPIIKKNDNENKHCLDINYFVEISYKFSNNFKRDIEKNIQISILVFFLILVLTNDKKEI
jgi:hypothetical protein